MTYSRIAGTGRYLPERIMTNFDLEKIVDTTDEWIRTRTGVERRHVVEPEQTTSDMCCEAAKAAMKDAGVKPEDVDFVITGTTTPDVVFPNISTIIQHRLGIPACPAFSLEAACTGFIYALTTADKFIRAGEARCALVMGAECITKLIDWNDRNTCVLFGDGAGAAIVMPSEEPGIMACHLGADGQYRELLHYPYGVSHHLDLAGTEAGNIIMKGNEVFKVAVTTLGNTKIREISDFGEDRLLIAETASINRKRVARISWIDLETGRTHQIRVHMAYLGHPVVGDRVYGRRKLHIACPRQFLHAFRLGFHRPSDGQWIAFESPLPADLEQVLGQLSVVA